MKLSSGDFEKEGRIPDRFTCKGEDISPSFHIDGIDPEAESLALIMDDPEAPLGIFIHWLIWNIPAEIDRIPSAVEKKERPKGIKGAIQGENDFNEIGYRGPCPPKNSEHIYRFNLYALNKKLNLKPGSRREKIQQSMEGIILEKTLLRCSFSR